MDPPSRLFVYGTLMSRFVNGPAVSLRRAAKLLGPATFSGRMYLVTANRSFVYPAVVASAEPGETVHGELFELRDTAVLDRLDQYEGAEYQRVATDVATADGSIVEANVYLFNASTDGLRHIPSGRFETLAH